MNNHKFVWLVLGSVWMSLLAGTPRLYAEDAPPEKMSRTLRNTLLAQAERQFELGEVNEALAAFGRLIEANPDDPHLWTRVGYLHLKKKNFKEANLSFRKAKKIDKNHVAAYVGLGISYTESPTRGLESLYNFRRAIGEAKRATKIDPEYGPAYRLLGEAYERFQEDHERAVKYYKQYVELEPDNPEGLYYFGLAIVQAKDFDLIEQYLSPFLNEHPDEVQLMPLVAQGYFALNKHERAIQLFDRYLQNIDGRERQLYTDIKIVASLQELEQYDLLSEPEQVAYLKQFWAKRDPDILTKVNERIIEHYRRVWYVRTFYSRKAYPWDQRGEVYVRYGEPEFRSHSNDRQFVQTPEVETVRTKMAIDMYGPEAAFLTFTGPVFPIRTRVQESRAFNPGGDREFQEALERENDGGDSEDLGADDGEGETVSSAPTIGLDIPTFARDPFDDSVDPVMDENSANFNNRIHFVTHAPVTIDNEFETVPWETWTYTKIGGGMEITFTDEVGNGSYGFAPMPDVMFDDTTTPYIARMLEHAPEVVVNNTISNTPDFYHPGLNGDVLNFYYDLADFKGSDGQTALEIYYGIPPDQVELEEQADSTVIHVQCALALADEGHTTVYRTAEEFLYRGSGEIQKVQGSFVPELLKTYIPPGKYQLQVQLKDLISGRIGLYRQELEVRDYALETLQVSDILLASAIEDSGAVKFKKQDIWILPMPTRSYSDEQNVHAYFEIYNLKKDSFGQTRYKAEYQVRSSNAPAVGVFGAVATGFRSLFKSKKPQVSVTYEQVGRESFEHEYVEVDLRKAKPGINALEIVITDLISGEKVNREVSFRYGN